MDEMRQSVRPSVTVVMPMYNAARIISLALEPLRQMLAAGEIDQILVVDDCSTDGGPGIVAGFAEVQCLRTPKNMGPGGARNLAATRTASDFLWFVDSDVVVARDAARVLCSVVARPEVSAVFGSYDEAPAARNFLSQYKNLVHHYYHQRAKREATTFWAGCGAVRRSDFLQVGGFDVARFAFPSVEDIDLGYRLTDSGSRVLFEPALQGKHLKEWRFWNLVHTEVFRRAIPWAEMMFGRTKLTNDLNVGTAERVRALVAGLLVLSMMGWGFRLWDWRIPVIALAVAGLANLEFIRFFVRRRGAWFAMRAFAFHQFYYLYSGAAFVAAWFKFKFSRQRR